MLMAAKMRLINMDKSVMLGNDGEFGIGKSGAIEHFAQNCTHVIPPWLYSLKIMTVPHQTRRYSSKPQRSWVQEGTLQISPARNMSMCRHRHKSVPRGFLKQLAKTKGLEIRRTHVRSRAARQSC